MAQGAAEHDGGGGGSGTAEAAWLAPYEQRAAQAEERLARLEAALETLGEAPQRFSFSCAVVKERQKLMIENSKLQYRVMHLIRTVREKEAS
eukprot:SM000171S03254  [mRNA]  locus=s171:259975:260764:- [translate_table: standard]